MSARNSVRYVMGKMPPKQHRRMARLARKGLNPVVKQQLKQLQTPWVHWITHPGAAAYNAAIRVTAKPLLTSRPGALPTFVGTGLDENVATRLLKQRANLAGITAPQAEDIFGSRSRTADLVWRTAHPGGAPAPGSWEPIAGHTPAIKDQLVGGTKGARTSEHNTRDHAREHAINTTVADVASPNRFGDIAVMSSLATIKHMASPSTELNLAKADMAAMPTPRYAALTGTGDLRQPHHFDSLVAHVQEERERKKWEVGAVMHGDDRLSPLVPPVIRSYLGTHGNDPHKAMESFRRDVHGWQMFAPPVNTSVSSDTRNLDGKSLHQMATKTQQTGRRQRALSDARILPPVAPGNSRG
ncbi:hypothetical protein [Dyella sp. GSA-30]|uniref:hypothetical protein n=1 Tax=Dyella sp. GSA-30 TaxID=2994496 RepID=UPI00248FCE7F|nr:hypothetical protein [Dyella sp. GSA-30]BDU21846.1 hypothetical protein DYGSA30_33030 [Dyella sp. GSA-30]